MYKKYPKYKDSGIEWIGEIPEPWQTVPIKYPVIINRASLPEDTDKNYELQYIDIGNVNYNGLIDAPKIMKFKDSPSRARRITKMGDSIISTVRTYLKAIAYINSEDKNLIASTGFAVLTPSTQIHSKYLYYFIFNHTFIETITSLSVGVGYPAINSSDLGLIPLLFPNTITEQKSIANFLNQKTSLIDTLIEKKQKQIELLKEYRTAIINKAVTKGLNPDVKMKDSGIEWLGEIPEHWEVKKLKYIINLKNGDGIESEKIEQEGLYEVYGGNGFLGYTDNYNVVENTLIVGRVGAKCGNVHFVNCEKWVSDNAIIVKTNQDYKFLYYLLISMNLNNLANQNAQPLITGTQIKSQETVIPKISEQIKIVEYIESKIYNNDKMIKHNKRQIELLKEYRTTLISETVTGKIDVRDWDK